MNKEDVERRILDIERRLERLENAKIVPLNSQSKNKAKALEDVLFEKVDDIGTQNLVIVALRLHIKFTKEQVKKVIGDWGKAYGDWFTGGNFNSRLVRRGIVKLEDTKHNNEDVFSLTKKGEKIADKLIERILRS